MAAGIESLQQEFASKSAEITSNIFRIEKESDNEKLAQLSAQIDANFSDAKSVLEKLDTAVKALPNVERNVHINTLHAFRRELNKLRTDFKSAKKRRSTGVGGHEVVSVELYDNVADSATLLNENHTKTQDPESPTPLEQTGEKILAGLSSATTSRSASIRGHRTTHEINRAKRLRVLTIVLRRLKQSKIVFYLGFGLVGLVLLILIYKQFHAEPNPIPIETTN